MIKRVYFLANKGSGKQAGDITNLKDLLDDAGIQYDMHIVSSWRDLKRHTKHLRPTDYDAIMVYGGDGSVLQVAHVLGNGTVPLFILPGGTNNALAQSLGQTLSAVQAVKALVDGRYALAKLDVGLVDGKPFIYDLHYGVFAKIIQNADKALKHRIGSLAYAVEAAKQLGSAQVQDYTLRINGRTVRAAAYMCYVSNSGLPQLLGVPLFTTKRAADGYLDVALIKTTNFWALMQWYWAKVLGRRGSSRVITLYRSQKIIIKQAPANVFYDDKTVKHAPPITITVQPQALPVIVPRKVSAIELLRNSRAGARTQWYRAVDHIRRMTLGMSALRFSQLTDAFYMGGQPGWRGVRKLQQWGITAIVSMREHKPYAVPSDMRLLHLPTTDHTAISLQDIKKGVAFIDKQIKAGGKVYVHCHMGEGRAASMAIAYLLSQGMFLNDALAFIKQRRVFVRPNTRQVARLREFARSLNKPANPR